VIGVVGLRVVMLMVILCVVVNFGCGDDNDLGVGYVFGGSFCFSSDVCSQ